MFLFRVSGWGPWCLCYGTSCKFTASAIRIWI